MCWTPHTFYTTAMRSSILVSSLAAALPIVSAAPEHCSESFFQSILPENATLLFAESVNENCTFNVPPSNIAYPQSPTNLPATCALQINVTSSSISAFSFGLFLPDPKTYNDRILGVGNGGFAGGVNWLDMAAGLHYGFASWSTDTGHNSTSGDLSWALNNEERRQDWGHRAIHGSAVMARQVAEAYYEAEAKFAYFSGCSTGGRQALREIQLHPETFDGVLAGSPAWWTDRLQTWSLWVGLLNLPSNSSSRIPPEAFPVIAKEVIKQCDWQDGLVDGIVSDSAGCHFVPEALLCSSPADLADQPSAQCLNPHQLATLKQIYADYKGADNALIFPGLELGSEAQWPFLIGASTPSTYGSEFVQDFVLDDPSWDPTTSYNSTIPFLASSLRPGNASATDFDLSPFQARGGKLIHHHGSADGLIPTGSSVYFHSQVQQTLQPRNISLDSFYRFFVVPGMQHCSGTPSSVAAPWYFAGPNQAAVLGTDAYGTPEFRDAAHDELLALMAWVEDGRAPDELVATEWVEQDISKGVARQRPLCAWPKQAKYVGEGDVDDAGSWKCEGIHGEEVQGYQQVM
jgi:feruloyl esterase